MEGRSLVATHEAFDLIARTLTPFIGRTMAEASVKMHCNRLGIGNDGSLRPEELESLIGRLSGALTVFVGADTTETVMARLRQGLGLSDGDGRSRP
jgi:hypothetical protein